MQVIRSFEEQEFSQVGWSARAMLVSAVPDSVSVRRLAGLGLQVQMVEDVYTAMSEVIEDPSHCDLLVVDCDGLGGLAEMRRVVKLMGNTMLRVPVILKLEELKRGLN